MTQGPDLAHGGPSITARRVAAYRLGFTRVPAPYGAATAAPAATTTRRPRKAQQAEQPQGPLSLSAFLSHALVAFTIELDNEAEHRLPHRTTTHSAAGPGDGTWLTSVAMFENCLRFVADQPITVGELETLARTETNLDGMRRWGYITIDGTAEKIHHGRPGPGAVLRATARGLQARQIWLPLPAVIERRWTERFGAGPIGGLRRALLAVAGRLDPGLPDTLPILGQVLFSRGPDPALPPRPEPPDVTTLPLSALLSRILLAFALDYEGGSEVSLAVGANLLRVLGAARWPASPPGACSPGASTSSPWVPSRTAGGTGSAATRSAPCASPWKHWPSEPTAARRPCSRA